MTEYERVSLHFLDEIHRLLQVLIEEVRRSSGGRPDGPSSENGSSHARPASTPLEGESAPGPRKAKPKAK